MDKNICRVVLVGNEEDPLLQQMGISKERSAILTESIQCIFKDIHTLRKERLTVSQSLVALSENCETVNELALFCLRLGEANGFIEAINDPERANRILVALFGSAFIEDQLEVLKEN